MVIALGAEPALSRPAAAWAGAVVGGAPRGGTLAARHMLQLALAAVDHAMPDI